MTDILKVRPSALRRPAASDPPQFISRIMESDEPPLREADILIALPVLRYEETIKQSITDSSASNESDIFEPNTDNEEQAKQPGREIAWANIFQPQLKELRPTTFAFTLIDATNEAVSETEREPCKFTSVTALIVSN